MAIDQRIVEYVAEKVLDDFRVGTLPDYLAQVFSKRPWVDALREKADAGCLNQIALALGNPNARPEMTDFALNIARCLDCQQVVPLVWATFRAAQDLGLKVSAMLLLAARGEMEGKWETELPRLSPDNRQLLDLSMAFYECNGLPELSEAIRARGKTHSCNGPYYDHLLRIIERL
jgi:hypothetical protein